ncbi:MAG: beta-1,6-N-acetylglucosaminyltransferase [Prevotellaceae bacterium]|jgi:hypothetical protein|nr:beta-1,6-N-acetylglucosaminyltransferase [Prevotellaceae bacterium]
MKNHAFLIIAHAYPELLEDIVNLLMASNHYFFINIDKKNKEIWFTDAISRLQKSKNVFFIEPVRVNHGGFSQVSATLKLLEEAYKSSEKMDYFHLISGQDYPCVSNTDLDAKFECEEKSYMHFDSPEEIIEWRKQKYPSRVNYFNFTDLHIPFLPYKILKLFNGGLNRVAKIYKRKSILTIYAGWQWFSWHRKVVEYVLTFVNDNPLYVGRFKNTKLVDELFFHTMLYDKAEELNIEKYNALRYIEWYPKREAETLPVILDEREYDDIVSSAVIFCRKIHPSISIKLIDLLRKKLF